MKPTKENITILKKLGFKCDKDKTGDIRDAEWYSLPSGWGFSLGAIRDFKHLTEKLQNAELNKLCEYVLCSPQEIRERLSPWSSYANKRN